MVVFPETSNYFVTIEDFSGSGDVLDVYFDDIAISTNPSMVFEGCHDPKDLVEGPSGCDCAASTNHGDYVSCVAHQANQMVKDGMIKQDEAKAMRLEAAKGNCGKKNNQN